MNLCDKDNKLLLWIGSLQIHNDIVKYLIKHGAKVNLDEKEMSLINNQRITRNEQSEQ